MQTLNIPILADLSDLKQNTMQQQQKQTNKKAKVVTVFIYMKTLTHTNLASYFKAEKTCSFPMPMRALAMLAIFWPHKILIHFKQQKNMQHHLL